MNPAENKLRLTDTNAASDSKGRTWGMEGGLFWWRIGGIGAGIIVFFVLNESLFNRLHCRGRASDHLPGLHLCVCHPACRATLWRMIKAGALQKIEVLPGSFRLRRADLEAIVGG